MVTGATLLFGPGGRLITDSTPYKYHGLFKQAEKMLFAQGSEDDPREASN